MWQSLSIRSQLVIHLTLLVSVIEISTLFVVGYFLGKPKPLTKWLE